MVRGDVVEVDLPQSNRSPGREQAGRRPAVILQNSSSIDNLPVVMLVPLTSNLGALRFAYALQIEPSRQNGLTAKSVAMVFQLRAIDKSRITRKLGTIETVILDKISQEARALLAL